MCYIPRRRVPEGKMVVRDVGIRGQSGTFPSGIWEQELKVSLADSLVLRQALHVLFIFFLILQRIVGQIVEYFCLNFGCPLLFGPIVIN